MTEDIDPYVIRSLVDAPANLRLGEEYVAVYFDNASLGWINEQEAEEKAKDAAKAAEAKAEEEAKAALTEKGKTAHNDVAIKPITVVTSGSSEYEMVATVEVEAESKGGDRANAAEDVDSEDKENRSLHTLFDLSFSIRKGNR